MDMWTVVFLVLFWPGPIGLGIFLACIGVYYWGLAKKKEAEKL